MLKPTDDSVPVAPSSGKWPRQLRDYLLASVCMGAALVLRLALEPFWGKARPYATFIAAIVVIVWFTNRGASLFAILASFVLADWFFVTPGHLLGFTLGEWVDQGFFFFICGALLWFAHRARGALAALKQEQDRLRAALDCAQRSEAEVGRRAVREAVVAQTANHLLKTDSPHQALAALSPQVLASLDCQVFFSFLVDEPTGQLRLAAYAGVDEAVAREMERLHYSGACGGSTGCRLISQAVCGPGAPCTELVRACVGQAYVCHSLVLQGRVLGLLAFGSRTRTSFSPEDLALMQTVADQLAIALDRQRTQGQLQDLNAALEQRVQERTQSLQETTAQLNAFCYSIAHDLRAPIRAQVSYAEILLQKCGARLSAEGRRYAERIEEAAQRQGKLVSDLLAHVSLGRAEMPVEPVNLAKAVELAHGDLQVEFERSQAVLRTEDLEGTLLANPSSLHLVILNLLSNALKFVARGTRPEVTVGAERRDGVVRLWVQDNGIGIPAHLTDKLFGVFQRLHGSESYPGTGIGLALVKEAIGRMGGRVGVESELGKGSRFWVELAKAP
ncbi:MAG TPA: ATP-binding protein [Bacillota bacterium]|nr:ATP-binding protein [Bacillota bacterium]